MSPRNRGRPPPIAGDGLPTIELPTKALDVQFTARHPRAQGARRVPRERLACLTRAIHRLGERALLELFAELAAGAELHPVLERYARLEPLAGFIKALNGDRLPPPTRLVRRRP
jgi:hypothetical protein